jgi:hypothetical protein
MEVRIIKSSTQESWYSDLIGEVFEVKEWGGDYVLMEDYKNGFNYIWRHISKYDCERV